MSHDPSFVAHLETRNNEFYAPLPLVTELPIVKNLTSDVELIKKALASSDQVIYDAETHTTKPIFKLVQRTTLILRDFPATIPSEVRQIICLHQTLQEVKALFSENGALAAAIVDLKPEVGDNYFIRFEDEEKTMSAWNFVRTKKYGGKPISARIKSESILKNSCVASDFQSYYQLLC